MHFKMIIIGENVTNCLDLLEQYSDNREVKFDSENGWWYNPDGHYDYYTIGGRFRGVLEVKDGCQEFYKGREYLPCDGDQYQSEKAGVKLVDGAYVKDILNLNSLDVYGYVDTQGWHDAWDEYEDVLYTDYDKKVEGLDFNSPERLAIYQAWKEELNQRNEEFMEKIRKVISKDPSKYIIVVDIHS